MLVSCSLGSPLLYGSQIVFLDFGHPRFRNFYSAVPVDVARVVLRGSRSINLTSFQRGKCLVLWACSKTTEGLGKGWSDVIDSRLFFVTRSDVVVNGL